jgi:Na+(H+)/acetate symporter ActP
MADRRALSQNRIDGLAAFITAAYLIGVGLTFLLERIGAPDGLVRAIDPLMALSALGLIGALLRTTRVGAFYAADRAASPLYGGLAFAAVAVSVTASSRAGAGATHALPIAPITVGFLLAALLIGPKSRQAGASALGDLLTARFDARAFRYMIGVVYFAVGALIAAAGFEMGTESLSSFLGVSQDAAVGLIAAIVVLIIAPGGFAGLVWTAATGAGMIAVVVVLPIALQIVAPAPETAPWSNGAEALATMSRALAQNDAPGAFDLLQMAALAAGTACLPPLAAGAFASLDVAAARRAGLVGAALLALCAVAFALSAPLWPAYESAASAGLRSSAAVVAALIGAAAGVQTASRATGAHSTYGQEAVLASTQLARSRGLALLAVAVGVAITRGRSLEPGMAMLGAASLSLAFIAPALALAVLPGATANAAIATLFASLGAIGAFSVALGSWHGIEGQAPTLALAGSLVGLGVGCATAFISRGGADTSARRQLFLDSRFDSGD